MRQSNCRGACVGEEVTSAKAMGFRYVEWLLLLGPLMRNGQCFMTTSRLHQPPPLKHLQDNLKPRKYHIEAYTARTFAETPCFGLPKTPTKYSVDSEPSSPRQRLVHCLDNTSWRLEPQTGFHLSLVEMGLSRLDVCPLLWERHLPQGSPEARGSSSCIVLNEHRTSSHWSSSRSRSQEFIDNLLKLVESNSYYRCLFHSLIFPMLFLFHQYT